MPDVKRDANVPGRLDPRLPRGFVEGDREFEIGVLLRQAREEAGLTQEELARKIRTQKTAISRLENHAGDIKLSTLKKVARALGKDLHVSLR